MRNYPKIILGVPFDRPYTQTNQKPFFYKQKIVCRPWTINDYISRNTFRSNFLKYTHIYFFYRRHPTVPYTMLLVC